MGRLITYRPLLMLDFEHAYYRDGVPRGLRLEAVGETARLLDRYGLRIDAQPGRVGFWRGEEPGRPLAPIPDDTAFAFALSSDDPYFLGVTQPDWPAAGAGLLYVSNRHVAQDADQDLPSSGFERLPSTRGPPILPASVSSNPPLRLSRWWSGQDLWVAGQSGAAPPSLAAGLYVTAAGPDRVDFLALDRRPDGLLGLLEIGLPRPLDAPAAAHVRFEPIVAIWDYWVRAGDSDLPLARCRVVSPDPRIAFDAPVAEAEGWRFSSAAPLPLAEAPANRLALSIPAYGLKTPDPVALPWPGPGQLRPGIGGDPARAVMRIQL